MKKIVFIFSALLIIASVKSQTINPFNSLKFDKVFICDFESNGEYDNPIVDDKGNFTKDVKKYIGLDESKIRELNSKLGNPKSYGQAKADCFEPHFCIVYFKNNKVTAQIKICLDCNRLNSSIDIPAQKQGKHGHGENVYYSLDGLSKSFRLFINDMIIQYKFSHPIKSSSIFDK